MKTEQEGSWRLLLNRAGDEALADSRMLKPRHPGHYIDSWMNLCQFCERHLKPRLKERVVKRLAPSGKIVTLHKYDYMAWCPECEFVHPGRIQPGPSLMAISIPFIIVLVIIFVTVLT